MLVEAGYTPNGEQFAEGSAQEQSALSTPFDLEGNIRALVDQERARSGEHFNAASWMHRKLYAMSSQQATDEANSFLWDLKHAYDVVAFHAYDLDTQDTVAMDLRGYATVYDRKSIALNPFGVRLLDALAEATNIPDYTPGQQEIELSHVINLSEASDLFDEEPGQ